MSLSIGRSLQEGIARTVARNGLLLAVLMAVSTALSLLAYNSALASLLPPMPQGTTVLFGPALPLSPAVAGAATVVLYLVSFVLVVAGLRTFVTEETRALPGRHFTRRLGWVLVNYVVGYVLFLLAIWIGFVLLVVPGLFLLVSLFFWYVRVAVEDEHVWAAFKGSWSLTRGNRWSLLGLGLVVTVVGTVFYGVLFFVAVAASPWVTLVVYAAVGSVFAVFSLATTARAYVQLAGDGAAA